MMMTLHISCQHTYGANVSVACYTSIKQRQNKSPVNHMFQSKRISSWVTKAVGNSSIGANLLRGKYKHFWRISGGHDILLTDDSAACLGRFISFVIFRWVKWLRSFCVTPRRAIRSTLCSRCREQDFLSKSRSFICKSFQKFLACLVCRIFWSVKAKARENTLNTRDRQSMLHSRKTTRAS